MRKISSPLRTLSAPLGHHLHQAKPSVLGGGEEGGPSGHIPASACPGRRPQADDPEFSLRAGGKGQFSQKIKNDDIVHIRRRYDSREAKGPSQSGFLGVRAGAGLSDEAQSLVDK